MSFFSRLFGRSQPVQVPAPIVVINEDAFYAAVASIVVDKVAIVVINASLQEACKKYGITKPMHVAMFLAQLAHESGGFRWREEIWGPTPAQLRYEGRADLGNNQPGDGYRYRGRGWIQLTGRANYERASKALGVNVVDNPDLAALPKYAALLAGWYWHSRNINAAADAGDFVKVTRLINGGTNGLEDRVRYLRRIAIAIDLDITKVRLQ